MIGTLPTPDWMAATEHSVRELATIALGAEDCRIVGHGAEVPHDPGAYLALLGKDTSLQVGLMASERDCQVLAKMLLGMAPEDEDLPASDLADAMCEMINVIAGGIKRRVSGTIDLNLGLPLFVSGAPQPGHQHEIFTTEVNIASASAVVLLLSQRPAEDGHARGALSRSSPRSDSLGKE